MGISEISEELKRTREKLKHETRNATVMTGKFAEYEAALKTAKHFREEIRLRDQALEELKASNWRKGTKVDELSAEQARLVVKLKKAAASSAGMEDARFYMEALSRLSILSRARADYKKTVVRLTHQQKRVLSSIRLDADLFVKGSAGKQLSRRWKSTPPGCPALPIPIISSTPIRIVFALHKFYRAACHSRQKLLSTNSISKWIRLLLQHL